MKFIIDHLQLQCTRGGSLDAFFEDFKTSPDPKIALMGCGCSTATAPVAEISHQWNIPQVLKRLITPYLNTFSYKLNYKHYFTCISGESVLLVFLLVNQLSITFFVQISFASALSSLTDRNRFKNYFRTTPSFKNYAPVLVALLNKFNWKRVAFLTESQASFFKVKEKVLLSINTINDIHFL